MNRKLGETLCLTRTRRGIYTRNGDGALIFPMDDLSFMLDFLHKYTVAVHSMNKFLWLQIAGNEEIYLPSRY